MGLAHSFGGSPGRGFLLQPRLILGDYNEHPSSQISGGVSTAQYIPGANGFSLQAGLDVGYQWRFGSLYLAVVGGLAAGVGSGIGVGDLPPFFITDARRRHDMLTSVISVNLQLLRVGYSF